MAYVIDLVNSDREGDGDDKDKDEHSGEGTFGEYDSDEGARQEQVSSCFFFSF